MGKHLLLVVWLAFACGKASAAMPHFCSLLVAAMRGEAPLVTLPTVRLDFDDRQKLSLMELKVRDTLGGGAWGFWDVFGSVSDRETFFSIKAAAHYLSGFDEEAQKWVDPDDALHFKVFSSRVLIDQCTLLSFLDAHVAMFNEPEAAADLDAGVQSFLENARRRLVLSGRPNAKVVPFEAHTAGGTQSYPSVQWTFNQSSEKLEPYLKFLGAKNVSELPSLETTMVVAPRFHAEALGNDNVWVQRGPEGHPMFVIPWRHFVNDFLGTVAFPATSAWVQVQFQGQTEQ